MSLIDNSSNIFFQEKPDSKSDVVENNDLENKKSMDNSTKDNFDSTINSSLQDNLLSNNIFYIRNIDIDELPSQEITRIIVAVGSKNLAHYLALVVNLENRSRKISPEIKAKVLSSKNLVSPSELTQKISSYISLNSTSVENVKKS